jgi:hypothetical protein
MTKQEANRPVQMDPRAFIDHIQAISRRHGLGSELPTEEYEKAVADSEQAFEGLRQLDRPQG